MEKNNLSSVIRIDNELILESKYGESACYMQMVDIVEP